MVKVSAVGDMSRVWLDRLRGGNRGSGESVPTSAQQASARLSSGSVSSPAWLDTPLLVVTC